MDDEKYQREWAAYDKAMGFERRKTTHNGPPVESEYIPYDPADTEEKLRKLEGKFGPKFNTWLVVRWAAGGFMFGFIMSTMNGDSVFAALSAGLIFMGVGIGLIARFVYL